MSVRWICADTATLADTGPDYFLAFHADWPEPRVRVGRWAHRFAGDAIFTLAEGGHMDTEPSHVARLPEPRGDHSARDSL